MADLESILLTLSAHGRPRISQVSDGAWYCAIDMHVVAKGAAFKIDSEISGHTTPISAARECLDRMDTILRGFTASGTVKAITHG